MKFSSGFYAINFNRNLKIVIKPLEQVFSSSFFPFLDRDNNSRPTNYSRKDYGNNE